MISLGESVRGAGRSTYGALSECGRGASLGLTLLVALSHAGAAKAFSMYELEGEPTFFLPALAPLPPERLTAQASRPRLAEPRAAKLARPGRIQLASLPQSSAQASGDAMKGTSPGAPAGSKETIRAMIARHASENGVPLPLADAVVRVESTYDPRASNGVNLGLTQISYSTARALGYAGPPSGLFDPETNLRYGIRYLADAYRLSKGDTCRTILKYQAGHRAVTMTSSAQIYCAKVVNYVSAGR
jgi:soluble lytic murein transglycosylase-like protein